MVFGDSSFPWKRILFFTVICGIALCMLGVTGLVFSIVFKSKQSMTSNLFYFSYYLNNMFILFYRLAYYNWVWSVKTLLFGLKWFLIIQDLLLILISTYIYRLEIVDVCFFFKSVILHETIFWPAYRHQATPAPCSHLTNASLNAHRILTAPLTTMWTSYSSVRISTKRPR